MNYINNLDPKAFITVYTVADMRYQQKVLENEKEVSDLLHQVCKLINVQYSVIIMYKERRSYNAGNKTNYRFKKYK